MLAGLHCLLPTANWTRALLAPALVFIATAIERNYQTDFWHHLARGRAIAEQGGLVNHDLFTYTVHGQPLQDANWLTQMFYHRLYDLGGLGLIQGVNSLILAVMMGLLVWMCRRASGSLLLACTLGVFTFFGLWQLLIIRPQTFSLLLFVVLYATLEFAERRRWLLVVPPLLLALWANLHGGFPIGLVLIGCYGLAAIVEAARAQGADGNANRRAGLLALCFTLSVLATLANPYGWKVYQYVGMTSTTASARRIDEWLPPGLNLLVGKVWVVSVLLVLGLFALSKRRPSVRHVCLVVCFLPLACGSVRMVAWWLLISAPIVTALIAANLPERDLTATPEPPSLAAGLFFGLLSLAIVLSVPGLERYNPVFRSRNPEHHVEADLEAVAEQLPVHGTHRIFSRFEWSEYLGWRLAPHCQVFMDGRIEIYPDDVWAQYDAVTRGRADWEKILDRYRVEYLLLDAGGQHAGLLPLVEQSATWEKSFQAGDALLFLRRPVATAAAR